MKLRFLTIALLASVILVGCDSRPDKVLGDGEMEDLLVDIYKSEAIIEMNGSTYDNDSLKAVVKQSVFLKHGVTQEEYDSSLVWYGHNVAKYLKVYDKVIARLGDEEMNIKKIDKPQKSIVARVKRTYPSTGDSADVWENEREWIFMPQYGTNIMRFDLASKMDDKNGDRYRFVLRLRNSLSSVKAYIGADYYDGSTSFVYRGSLSEGENSLELQGDSTKRVRRVYGYIMSRPSAGEMAFVDSVMLLRTRLDKSVYSSFNFQKWAGPKSLNPETVRKAVMVESQRKEEYAKKVQAESSEAVKNEESARPRRYAPKPGLNKSSHKAVND